MAARCSPQSGPRAGYDGYKRKKGSKVHMAVDTLGHLPAVHVTPASEQERAQVRSLAQEVQHVTSETVKVSFVDQGYTGQEPAEAAREAGIEFELHVVKLPEATKRFCAAAPPLGRGAQLRLAQSVSTPARDYGRLPETLAGLHFVVFTILMPGNAASLLQSS
jgi:hypothetical protein